MRRKEYRSGFIVRTALDEFDLVPRTLRDIEGFRLRDALDTDFTDPVDIATGRLMKWAGTLLTGKAITGPLLSSDMGDDSSPGSDDKVPTEKAVKLFLKMYMAGMDLQESVKHKGFNSPYEAGGGPFVHGEGYLIGNSPTDEWAGHPEQLTYWDTSLTPDDWIFITNDAGLLVEVEDENSGFGVFYYYTGSEWRPLPYLQDIIKIGAIDPNETEKGATHEEIYKFVKAEAAKAAIVYG